MAEKPYRDRYGSLTWVLFLRREGAVRSVEGGYGLAQKESFLKRLKKANAEGVVFKHLDAPYVAGRPASGGPQLKFKFVETASCIVAAINAKRSVALQVYGDTPTSVAHPLVDIGNCAIPPNYDLPKAGDVVEIQYLYAYPNGGSLYQPVYKGVRDDIPASDCVISQLKLKPE